MLENMKEKVYKKVKKSQSNVRAAKFKKNEQKIY